MFNDLIWLPLLYSFCFGFSGAWFMSRYAYRLGLVDIPNDRSSHTMPTPRGGGIGILLAYVTTSLITAPPLIFWLPAAFISLVSFFDDKLNLTPKTRLLFQFASAIIALFPLWYSLHLGLLQSISLLVFFSVFIVSSANFYNFMDGINGIAGLTGVIAFALLALFSHNNGQISQAILMLSISVACIGFLPFNIPSASVFMGDVGSILLGFAFSLSVAYLTKDTADFFALCGCLFPFYADTLSTLYLRWRAGEKLSQAHRRHLYQLLANQMNIPHWKVSLGYVLLQAVVGIVCLKLLVLGSGWVITFLSVTFILWCLCMHRIRKVNEP